ncbi:phosphatidate cytidylyltransferase [Telluria aromaticivorans]|uniref:Phosphatidate cytidylyltransferase n=1 Tax=Telluria aromaticivorans TaxID=2725995 RepID=A0A7Y2NXI5_9BURK|nr:phosphatidate cytidylyltransferase [Telluria aromaticivorans]NNG21762.1 phosphatidate cytidylyltransferase [Telluria aromaticivorans]
MLKTRILTALVLLAVLLPVLYLNNFMAFAVLVSAFFGAAIWECFRLFNPGTRMAPVIAAFWTAAFVYAFFISPSTNTTFWFAISVLVWALRFAPSLKLGLPALNSTSNTFLSLVYAIAVVGCFAAIVTLFAYSPLYLLSVMAIVWVADIFAYFSGKAFGKRKLAPSISPGKSWEGAIGGCIAVLVIATLSIVLGSELMEQTFAARVQASLGWGALAAVLILIVAASVVGDLFESQLKRRAGMKDSSNLLPGHGGVLDRVDALVPVLPLAALIGAWL